MTVSRRGLIHGIGRAGGLAAAYRSMAAMGLLATPAYAGPPDLPPGGGAKVLILGAGIAGMVAAWELKRAGFAPTILEARARPGGRNWTLRAADAVVEHSSAGETIQRVRWDSAEHLYFNPGPARLPYHHQGILSYCRELGVALEVMCNDNRGALMHDDAAFGGAPQANRAVVNDVRGQVAELAAKAVDHDLLDQPVSAEDRERLRAMLRAFGALDTDLVYRGSQRAGYTEPPDAAGPGRFPPPLDPRQLLASEFWQGRMQFGELATQAATMVQPVGGMGRIGEAFGRRLTGSIVYNAEVTALRRDGEAMRIEWRDTATGLASVTEAGCVICTIPFAVLRGIDSDFAPATRAAIAALAYVPAGKVGFQARRRFWEQDQAIYGGISWTSRDITQVWYPSAGLHARKGVLMGAYVWSEDIGLAFAAKTPEQRLAATLGDLAVLHPQAGAELEKGISVAWPNIAYSGAAWAEWDAAGRADAYPTLLAGDGPVIFAGEHMSYVTGWQEGAVLSAHHAVAQAAARLRK